MRIARRFQRVGWRPLFGTGYYGGGGLGLVLFHF
jgi:hypothetical protein